MDAMDLIRTLAGYPTCTEMMAAAETDDEERSAYEEAATSGMDSLDWAIVEARKIIAGGAE